MQIMRNIRYLLFRIIHRIRMSNVKKYVQQALNRNKTNEYTKMVKAISKRRKSVIENDPIRQRMVKERQEHAKRQESDYSHVFRKKTRLELIRLSMIITGIEFAYSAETAFVSPILLSIGIEHKHMTMVWAISPFLGFFLSPILGSISDRCNSRFGRRRPIIALLAIGLVLGLILAPYGRDIGTFLGDVGSGSNITNNVPTTLDFKIIKEENPNGFFYAILFTVLGTLLLDFNADNCQNPARAYLLDVCLPEEHAHALSTFTIMAGVGGCLGYAFGAINWDETVFSNIIGDNIKTVFTLVTIIFVIAMLISISSFREIPLKLMDSDEMLRPVTQLAVKKEKERLKGIENSSKQTTSTAAYVNPSFEPESSMKEENQTKNYLTNSHRESSISVSSSSDDEDDEQDESITMMMYLKSIIFMPKSLRILCITNCLCWMGHILYCLYFTDFVGETVFKGNPAAPIDSEEYLRYDEGIRFGCWGMALYALSCSFYSMIIEKMIKKFTAKIIFVGGMLQFSLAMALLAYFPTKIGVILFSMTGGVVYATLFTIPFLLVAQYHSKGTFKIKRPENNNIPEKVESSVVEFERGLGTDCGIVGSMMFVAQFTMSLSIGTLIWMIGSVAAVLYAASFFSLLGAISACYIVYMDL